GSVPRTFPAGAAFLSSPPNKPVAPSARANTPRQTLNRDIELLQKKENGGALVRVRPFIKPLDGLTATKFTPPSRLILAIVDKQCNRDGSSRSMRLVRSRRCMGIREY